MKILVTGGNNGLGLDLCSSLLKDGHEVFAISKNINNLRKIQNINFKYFKVDIRKYKKVKDTFAQIKKKYKKFDILVNNAGIYSKSLLQKLSCGEIDRIIDTIVKGTIYVSKLMLMELLPGPGKIIIINSVAGTHGIREETVYSASKFALRGFAESLQYELKNKKISITNIYPGGINTSLWNKKNVYNGNINKLLKTQDIIKIINLIINFPTSQIFKNLTIYPTNEDH